MHVQKVHMTTHSHIRIMIKKKCVFTMLLIMFVLFPPKISVVNRDTRKCSVQVFYQVAGFSPLIKSWSFIILTRMSLSPALLLSNILLVWLKQFGLCQKHNAIYPLTDKQVCQSTCRPLECHLKNPGEIRVLQTTCYTQKWNKQSEKREI